MRALFHRTAAARRTAFIDIGKFFLVAGIALWLLTVGTPGLGYHWQWYRVPRFLFTIQEGVWTAGPLLQGLLVTLEISALSLLCTLVLYEAAYITEIVRAGIESIEKDQWEAAHALGLSRWQQLRFVILPQALQKILPALAGQLISTIKDSAIVSVISIPELTFRGLELMSATYLTFEIWITITALYFLLTFTCSLGVKRLETVWQR